LPTDKNPQATPVLPASTSGCATCGTAGSMTIPVNQGIIQPGSLVNAGTAPSNAGQSDAEALKNIDQKIKELRKLKESGIKRGDVELLPELEKQSAAIKERIKQPSSENRLSQ